MANPMDTPIKTPEYEVLRRQTELAYSQGYEIGLDALDAFQRTGIEQSQYHSAFAGILTAIITAMFHMAPDEKTAHAVLAFALHNRTEE